MPSEQSSGRAGVGVSSHAHHTILGQGSFGVVRVAWAFRPISTSVRRTCTGSRTNSHQHGAIHRTDAAPVRCSRTRSPRRPDSARAHFNIAMTPAEYGLTSASSPDVPCAYTVAVKTVSVVRAPHALIGYIAQALRQVEEEEVGKRQAPRVRDPQVLSAHPVVDARLRTRQRGVWNELLLLDHIRDNPHPNIVQCLGFSFRSAMAGVDAGSEERYRRDRRGPPEGRPAVVGPLSAAVAATACAVTTTEAPRDASTDDMEGLDLDKDARAATRTPSLCYCVPKSSSQPLESLAQAARRAAAQVIDHVQRTTHIDLTDLFTPQCGAPSRKSEAHEECEEAYSSRALADVDTCACTADGLTLSHNDPARRSFTIPYHFVLDSVREAEVVLSLCSGGTLKEYVEKQSRTRCDAMCASVLRASQGEHASDTRHAANVVAHTPKPVEEVCAAHAEHAETEGLKTRSQLTGSSRHTALLHGLTPSPQKDIVASPSSQHDLSFIDTACAACAESSQQTTSPATAGLARARWTLAVSERCLVAILVALLHALRHIHTELRVLHRDVKPANVLLCVGDSAECPASQKTESPQEGSANEPTMWWSTRRPYPAAAAREHTTETAERAFPILVTPASRDPVRLATVEVCQHKRKGARHARKLRHQQEAQPPSRASSTSRTAWQRHVEVHVLPQPEAWRVQLADFGVSTSPGQLRDSQCGVGTAAFMAPEVRFCGVPRGLMSSSAASSSASTAATNLEALMTPLFTAYGEAADVYSLGATFQYLVVRAMAGAPNLSPGQVATLVSEVRACTLSETDDEDPVRLMQSVIAQWTTKTEEGIAWRQYVRTLPQHAIGACWIDEEGTPEEAGTRTEEGNAANAAQTPVSGLAGAPPDVFVVPRAWRCDQEVAADACIRTRRTRFVVPSAWRCREERLHAQRIRRPSTARDAASTSVPQEDMLYEGSTPGSSLYKRQQRRCRSCGKLHRHLVELLNAMTEADPGARPTVLDCLRSTAVLEQGRMEEVPAEMDAHRQGRYAAKARRQQVQQQQQPSPRRAHAHDKPEGPIACHAEDAHSRTNSDDEDERGSPSDSSVSGAPLERTYLWRPPSLHFLKSRKNVHF